MQLSKVLGLSAILAGVCASAAVAVPSTPATTDQATRTASYCTQHFAREERTQGIPKHLMFAISTTESGRWNDHVGMVLPWPWTINAEGKGHYYETKHDAVTAVRRLMSQGVKSIDVGCMQISLKHHPKAFASISEAFDPAKNVAYAAQFLKANFNDTASWTKAVAAYHSKTPSLGSKYFSLVKGNWKKVIAALGNGNYDNLPYLRFANMSPQLAAIDLTDGYENEKGFPGGGTANVSIGREAKPVSIRRIPRMKVIRVTSVAEREKPSNEVLVIRPTKKNSSYEAPEVQVASRSAEREEPLIISTRANVSVGKATQEAKPTGGSGPRVISRQGPRFIFEN